MVGNVDFVGKCWLKYWFIYYYLQFCMISSRKWFERTQCAVLCFVHRMPVKYSVYVSMAWPDTTHSYKLYWLLLVNMAWYSWYNIYFVCTLNADCCWLLCNAGTKWISKHYSKEEILGEPILKKITKLGEFFYSYQSEI